MLPKNPAEILLDTCEEMGWDEAKTALACATAFIALCGGTANANLRLKELSDGLEEPDRS